MTPTEALKDTLEKLNTARTEFEPYEDLDERTLELTESEKDSGVYQNTAKKYKKQLDDAWAYYRKAVRWMELESNFNNAKVRLAQAQKDYDALNDPNFGSDTAGARAALANAEVRAPFPGVITKLDLKVGEFAASGQTVVTIADMSQWVVKTTDLTEIDVINVKEGQAATVTLDALPDSPLNAVVQSISNNYAEKQGDIVYEVTLLLTDSIPEIRWGMTAEVKFTK
jgi:multidrug resistance efflux pump